MQVGIQGEDQGSHSCREHPPNPEMAAGAPSALSDRESSHEHSDTCRGSREGGRIRSFTGTCLPALATGHRPSFAVMTHTPASLSDRIPVWVPRMNSHHTQRFGK